MAKDAVAESPLSPFGPAGPAGPGGRRGPAAPAGPAGIWPDLKSARSREPFATLDEFTAFALSCAVPTLFLGRTAVTAATLVPASAMPSARHATTIAGDGRRRY